MVWMCRALFRIESCLATLPMMGNLLQVVQRKFLMSPMQYGNVGAGLPTGACAVDARTFGFANQSDVEPRR